MGKDFILVRIFDSEVINFVLSELMAYHIRHDFACIGSLIAFAATHLSKKHICFFPYQINPFIFKDIINKDYMRYT